MNDRTSPNTILIVEDEKLTLEVLSQFLKKQGFKVLLAQNGSEGIQVAKHAHPDLILLDVMMPVGMSGFEVCQRLKTEKTTHDIPIIFMTSLTDTVDKVKGFESGAADYITKPFQYEELLARVNAHLSIRKLQLELKAQNQLLKDEMSRSQKLEDARQKTHQLLEQTLKSQVPGTEEEKHKKTELEKHNTERDAFAQTLAHDLKPPLNTLATLSTWLKKNCSSNRRLDAQTKQTVNKVAEAGQLAINIVDASLLSFSIERQEPVELELVEMSDIVAKVVEERLAHKIEQYQAKIKLAEIWPTVPGYTPWLYEIWMNYISNALKYGGKPPHLELGAVPNNRDMIRFWVRDNGQGLTKAESAKLFTPSNVCPVGAKGEGLGLSIVQQLVEKQGGQVGVESTKGQGSLFYFTLPAYR